MQTLYQRVAGLDVHKKTIVACVRIADSRGRAEETILSFGAMTEDLLALADWLTEQLCP